MSDNGVILPTTLAVLLLSVIGTAAVVLIALHPKGENDMQNIILIFGFLSPTITALIAVINSHKNTQEIGKVQDALIKNNARRDDQATQIQTTLNENTEITKQISSKLNEEHK